MTCTRIGRPTPRLQLESLEDRSVPATFTVNTTLDEVTPGDGKLSLREAITKADAAPGADVIVLPAGVFKMTNSGAGEDANATGDLDITDSLTIQGAGAGISIVDGQQLDRVFDVFGTAPGSIRVVLQGLTVRNGKVTGTGGGIQVANADLVIRNSVVSGNRATGDGGAISNAGTGNVTVVRTTVARNAAGGFGGGIAMGNGSQLTINDSFLRRNSSVGFGGGIFASKANLTNTIVSGNRAVATSGFTGGGIAATTVTLTNCTVSDNLITGGTDGGIGANTATLTNCTVSGNFAGSDGGGIGAGIATLTRCTVSGNTAGGTGNGGGINAQTANLTNTTVSGNTAATNGGDMNALNATLLNCTVAENLAQKGGGLFAEPGGNFNIRNTIVALNLTDFSGSNPDVVGTFVSQGHNLIGNGTGGFGFTIGTNGDIVGTSTNPIDPKLGPLANNGGPTKTMALLEGSPAIDHGDNRILPPTDQRGAGFARKRDGNDDGMAIVDIGAFER